MSHVIAFSPSLSSGDDILTRALNTVTVSSTKVFTAASDTGGTFLRSLQSSANQAVYRSAVTANGDADQNLGDMLRIQGDEVIRILLGPDQTSNLIFVPEPAILDEIDDMTAPAPSRMETFLTHTLPVMATIVVTVIGSAWVLYTRLDDGIDDARKEAKADLQVFSARSDTRFDKIDAKLETVDRKLDEKTSAILSQMTDLRVRQTQVEAKQ